MEKKSIGTKLYELRKQKGLSMQALADHLLVSRQTISKWESDMSLPDIEVLMKICDYYEITINELLSDTKDSGGDITTTYEQLQQVLSNLQHQNRRKNIFNIILICISIFSLCVSLMLKSQMNGLVPEEGNTYFNFKSDPINQINKNSELLLQSSQSKMNMVVDLSNLTAMLDYRFFLKETTDDMKVSLEFQYQNLYAAYECFTLPMDKVKENEFILQKKVPLQNYINVILAVEDETGRIQRENIGTDLNCCYLSYVMKNIVNFYVPVGENGKLDLNKIMYEPTTFNSKKPEMYHGKLDCKGKIQFIIKDAETDFNYVNEKLTFNENGEINLDQSLPLDKNLFVNIIIYIEDERFEYNPISFGFSVNLYEMKSFQIQQQSESFYIYRS